jgi:hypothetical protein
MAKIQPGMPPPPGVESNFEHPDREVGTFNIITQSLCITFTSIFFLLRMYIKIYIHKTLGREDCEPLFLVSYQGGSVVP